MANIRTLVFAPDGRSFATAVEDNARVWDAATCEPLTPALDSGGISSLSYSPDSRWLATGSGRDACAVWEVATGRRACRIPNSTRSAYLPVVAFSPAGRYLAANFGDTVELWEYDQNAP